MGVVRKCSIDGCEKRFLARDLCRMHYQRFRTFGYAGEAEPRKVHGQADCKAHGCTNKARSRNLCPKHYKRWQHFGEDGINRLSERDPKHVVTYYGAHVRTRTLRGHANLHACVHCGECAAEWSYMHDDPDEVIDDRGISYSQDPYHYQPMCIKCHRNYDLDFIQHKRKATP